MTLRARTSFRQRLTLITMSASALALLLAFATLVPLQRRQMREDARTDLVSLAHLLADANAAPLVFGDARAAEEGLRSLAAKPQIVGAALYDRAGRRWVTYGRPHGRALLPESVPPPGYRASGDDAVLAHEVVMDGERVGVVYLVADLQHLRDQWRSYLATLTLVLLVCAAGALGLAARLHRSVARPVAALATAALRVSDHNDYSVRVPSSGVGELQDLAEAFNVMLARIQDQDAALRAARDDLEERVRERVADLRAEIQDRRQAEQALRASEQRYRSIVETTNEWIWSMDRDGRSLYDNPAVERILGYQPHELKGRSYLDLFHPDDRARLDEAIARSIETRTGWTGLVVRCRHRSGLYRTLESNATAVLDDEGKVVGLQGSDRDITNARALEEQLRQSQKMEAIGRLAGGIAHDFNNLLGVIIGYSELVMRRFPDHPAAPRVRQIEDAAQRAAGLTRQLLTFSRKQILEPRVVDVGRLVSELGAMLPRLLGEDIRLTIDVAPRLDSVKADPTQLEQVVMNLAVNARDAMPRGGDLSVAVRMATLDQVSLEGLPPVPAGRYVVLSVSDTGCGMDPETLSHVFEPFFTTKEKGKGTGLGLATVYGVVSQTGGHVTVESVPQKGTTLTIFLPPTGDQPAAVAGPVTAPVRGRETVLVVEDEPSLRLLAREVLQDHGYDVLCASDGEEALQVAAATSREIHVLLTDVVMPRLGGPALAEQLVQARPGLHVLFMSGYTADTLDRHGAAAGALLLHKPFTPDALLRKVREALGPGPVEVPAARVAT